MAWCHQATSHYLSQCWPRSLSRYGVTRPQWVKCLFGVNVETHLSLVTHVCITELGHHWFRQWLIKPLSKSMLTSRQSHPKEQTSMKNYQNQKIFTDEIAIKVIICNFAAILSRGGEFRYYIDRLVQERRNCSALAIKLCLLCTNSSIWNTVETLYSTIYYSKYFIELNIDKSTQYVALFGRAMECPLWVL